MTMSSGPLFDEVGREVPFAELLQALRDGDEAAWNRVFEHCCSAPPRRSARRFGAAAATTRTMPGARRWPRPAAPFTATSPTATSTWLPGATCLACSFASASTSAWTTCGGRTGWRT